MNNQEILELYKLYLPHAMALVAPSFGDLESSRPGKLDQTKMRRLRSAAGQLTIEMTQMVIDTEEALEEIKDEEKAHG